MPDKLELSPQGRLDVTPTKIESSAPPSNKEGEATVAPKIDPRDLVVVTKPTIKDASIITTQRPARTGGNPVNKLHAKHTQAAQKFFR